jgi:hypothetical protein
VFLSADVPPGEVGQVAQQWLERQEIPFDVNDSRPVKIAGIDAWRVEASASGRGGPMRAQLTFIPFRDATWRITGAAPAVVASRHEAAMLSTARSFRRITPEELSGIQVTRLQVETRTRRRWPRPSLGALAQRMEHQRHRGLQRGVREPPLFGGRAGEGRRARAVRECRSLGGTP